MVSHFNDSKLREYKKGVKYTPFYSDEADYNTNAPSYYDYLARYNGFISSLVDFVNGLADDIDDIMNKYEAFQLSNDEVVYTVGSEGDFESLNDCFDKINNLIVQPVKITVILLKDYIMREQLFLENKRYNHIVITSDKPIVRVDDTRQNIDITVNDSDIRVKPMFYGYNCTFPKIDFKLECVSKEDSISTGFLMDNSNLTFTEKGGATYFGFIGVYGVNNSNIVANGCDFSNNGIISTETGAGIKITRSSLTAEYSYADKCGEYGYWIQSGSIANVNNSHATHCRHHNLVISQGSTGSARNSTFTDSPDNAVVVSTNSNLDLSNCDCSRCGSNNVVVQLNSTCYFENSISNDSGISGLNVTKHSFVAAQDCSLQNNARHGLDSKDGSDVNVLGATITGNEGYGIYCLDGSHVVSRGATISNNGDNGIHCYGGNVDAYKTTIKSNGGSGIRSFNGGRVTADESNIQDNNDYGLHASRGEIWASKGICKNNKSSWDIGASWGSSITCSEVEVSSTGETIRCTSSSIIKASDVIGSAVANKAVNEINEQGLILGNNIVTL